VPLPHLYVNLAVCLSVRLSIWLFAAEFLLPLFFANSGIRTDIGTLDSGRYWAITIAITAIACFAKFTPSCLVGKLVTKREWRFCVTLGLLMNTRGLVEVIALNIGLTMVGAGLWGGAGWDMLGSGGCCVSRCVC
jgi:Kef-type K+ transport system membrane component KefB